MKKTTKTKATTRSKKALRDAGLKAWATRRRNAARIKRLEGRITASWEAKHKPKSRPARKPRPPTVVVHADAASFNAAIAEKAVSS